jgi:hypothetical protein
VAGLSAIAVSRPVKAAPRRAFSIFNARFSTGNVDKRRPHSWIVRLS